MEDNSSVFDSDIVKVDKYEPHKIANGKNEVTFFVASDEIDFADLQRYRIQAQTDYLIAINGTGKDLECLKLADNVITCLPDEIEIVMFAFKSLVLNDSFMGFEWNDIRSAIHKRKHIQFIQGFATDKNYVANACDKLIAKLPTIKNDFFLKAVMVDTLADDSFGFDQLACITERLQENLNIDPANIFYQLYWFEEFDYWEKEQQGCCICMFLIYADKENDIQPVTIEQNIPKKTPDTTQIAGNSIREYLKRQQQRNRSES